MADFPGLRWPALYRVLRRRPLSYEIVRQRGSHKLLKSSAGYPDLRCAWHDNAEIAPGQVRKILTEQVGLSEEEALGLL